MLLVNQSSFLYIYSICVTFSKYLNMNQVMPRVGERILEKVITLRGLPRDIISEFLKEHDIILWHPEIQENLKSWNKIR